MTTSNPQSPNAGTTADPLEVARVVHDLEDRTLVVLDGHFNQLVYLASLRDHNTGRYHHYGLEERYTAAAVDEGLRQCHVRVFEDLVVLPLKEQTEDLLGFFESQKEDKGRLVEVWNQLRSYHVLPPEGCHPLARELFDANIRIMLRILRETELWPLLHDPHHDADDLP
ncbi:MAG TPA: hypothetical protein VMO17_01350 [Terriglobia bacterium]|nr:hypothetical protein [Terriglobia bacterium]